jgi:TP901 family phage tail tape measure protein
MPIDRLAQLAVDIVINTRRAQLALHRLQGQMGSSAKSARRLRDSLIALGLGASVFLLFRKAGILLTQAIRASVDAFVSLEEQIANVSKISKKSMTDTAKDVFNLSRQLVGVNFETITDTMQSVARAGVGDALEEFTKAAVILQRVSGDIGSREAAEGLAALQLNLKDSGRNAMQLASGIDALSDNFLVTSGEILKTSARLSGFADAAGISVEDLNALSASLLSTKVSATVVRTSISKLLIALQSEPLKVGEALKLTREETERFFVLIRTKPVEAIKAFTEALQKLTPGEQTEALKELGIASARVRSVIEILKGNLDSIGKAQQISTDATLEGVAALQKQITVASTAAAKIEEMKKEWTLFKASLIEAGGPITFISGLLRTLSEREGAPKNFASLFEDITAPTSEKSALIQINALQTRIVKIRKTLVELDELEKKALGGFRVNYIDRINLTGEIVQLEQKINLLQQVRLGFQEAEKNKLKEIEQQAAKNAELAKKEAAARKEAAEAVKAAAIEASKGLTERLTSRAISLDPDPTRRRIRQLLAELAEAQAAFDALKNPTLEVMNAFHIFRSAILASIDAIKAKAEEDKKEAARKKREEAFKEVTGALGGFAGPFGDFVKFASEIQKMDAMFKGDPKVQGAFQQLFKARAKELTTPQRTVEFTGLTEAWKRAQKDTQKDDTVAKAQLTIAQRMVQLMITGEKQQATARKILEGIFEAVTRGAVLR